MEDVRKNEKERRNELETLQQDHQEEQVVEVFNKKEVKRCHYEDWTKTKGTLALDGLHSNFITPQIIATSRPTRKAIEEHSLYKRLRELDVRLIVNLQQPFEHPKCAEEGLKHLFFLLFFFVVLHLVLLVPSFFPYGFLWQIPLFSCLLLLLLLLLLHPRFSITHRFSPSSSFSSFPSLFSRVHL
jgi:hypothetical protein